ncbi:NAD(P)/FAD-dependent oxidoreductase [Bathymodiolus platifrons methanotrophic gill symbiont]|uniref:NAD(P)/FAD-dependent oxidoreductase n=1 Tax=Bathymodiolus platifrons methanotrophic gill symbiont TaxID=113268 RepID=UPI00245336A9|nr:FAD-dependent oxidoreductase [Bathymodiolus platifrons methanotrophic gill symbiont]
MNISVFESITVTGIDRSTQSVHIQGEKGAEALIYDRLVIATGSAAFIPPPFYPFRDNFYVFNSLHDLIELRHLQKRILDEKKRATEWAIIGGGLIGCELSSDLAVSGDKVSLFHAENRLMERQLVAEDSLKLLAVMHSHSIDVKFQQAIQAIEKIDGRTSILTEEGHSVYDAVIVSCGFKPRTELAGNIGLETQRGILVNRYLQTSDKNIFSLGDVAELPDNKLYAYILPIRSQANWLATYLCGQETAGWQVPDFSAVAKVHGFEADHPYVF